MREFAAKLRPNMADPPDYRLVTMTVAILVLFAGVHLNRKVSLLRQYNIPEPVTGGLLAAVLIYLVYLISGTEMTFNLEARDQFLIYFFTGIGLNARISDLIKGGKPLVILLVLTLGFIVVQNIAGIAAAIMVGQDPAVGVLAGSASLIGGHGTAIAWAPEIKKLGIDNAMEIGVASATLGLILASLIGGPISKFLIARNKLKGPPEENHIVGLSQKDESPQEINHFSIMSVILVIHICMIIGYLIHQQILAMDFSLPLFVPCLLVGILLSNTVPHFFPKIKWPARTRALALVSDFSLGIFLSMTLMSMKLWELASLAGPLLIILVIQTVVAFAFIIFVLFKLMGRDYQAAVLSAGFGGFALGATPVAIANMTAVTKAHGPAPMAFIMLPLVGAFFVDITNAFIIRFALQFCG